ncbi:glycosyltransferase [Microvirga solisilvae]|uniref:glycosyltransferase n=1 Tax=Microvirga solisilvae TaxID=2919498 RepID=UPI001FB00244|nr:glycosyltransferase [Microvirga solisilvae]
MRETIAILSFSRIARDQRVLRQCDLVAKMGHNPKVIGYAAPGETIGHDFASWPLPSPTLGHRIGTLVRQLPAHMGKAAAMAGFWSSPRYRWALNQLKKARPRLVIANDWPALVVAARWKAECGGRIHYDSHEFATLEFDERAWWRVVYKPFVSHLEKAVIGAADSVSTISPGLAQELQRHYNLSTLPVVIRSIPNRYALPVASETRWPLRLLFHGQILPGRGLENLIDSIPLWRSAHRLIIRGDGNPAYLEELRQRAANVSTNDQVIFEPAVAPEEVIPSAARTADVGVFFTPLQTVQHQFTLPNKLFEYIGAGLAIAVSPGSDLKRIVLEHGIGVVSGDVGPEAIGATINELTPEAVDGFRLRAREASQILCWEQERERLRSCIEALLTRSDA